MCQCGDVPPTKRADAEAIVPDLADELARLRDNGHSYADIAFVLRADHDIVVTAETVRQWCHDDGAAA